MNVYGGGEVRLHAFLMLALHGADAPWIGDWVRCRATMPGIEPRSPNP